MFLMIYGFECITHNGIFANLYREKGVMLSLSKYGTSNIVTLRQAQDDRVSSATLVRLF
jgi:hypothetical protein